MSILSLWWVVTAAPHARAEPVEAATIRPAEYGSRPNVLFIISDDLNTRLGCYGDEIVQSPHIDSLARRGMRFEHAYCQYPLCGPSRNSMLCGLYPSQTGILGNATIFRQTIPDHVSLPQAFRRAGYFAGRIGKLYHYHVPLSMGTNGNDDPASWEMVINPAGCDRMIEQPDIFTLREGAFGGTLSWYASPRPDPEHTDGMIADEACWMLDRFAARKDRPFFLAVGMFRPHTPYVAPEEYFRPYSLDRMPVIDQDTITDDRTDVPKAALMSHKSEHDKLTDPLRRECLQAYFASTTFMDAQVGKILDRLEANGLDKNTIVVFTSDHGYHLGEKGLWQKQSLFEESARVPLIIAPPTTDESLRQHIGQSIDSPVGLIDLYRTLTNMCDVEVPVEIAGQDLTELLRDPNAEARGWSLSQMRRNKRGQSTFDGYSIRTPRYRYTEWAEGERGRELYDHNADPMERDNLIGDAKHASVAEEMSELLRHAKRQASAPEQGMPKVQHPQYLPVVATP